MGWFEKMARRVENKVVPWVQRRDAARRDAIAAAHELDMVRGRRPIVDRLVFELGVHQRENHFVDIVHNVTKGLRP